MYDEQNKNIFYFPFTPKPYVAFKDNEKQWITWDQSNIKLDSIKRKVVRINRYFDYKTKLAAYAKSQQFVLPYAGAAIYFYVPMPVRWTKAQREIFHQAEHQRTPDLSNLLKAIEDALHPKTAGRNDKFIYHYAGLGKFWVDTFEGRVGQKDNRGGKLIRGDGWIEIHTNLPVYNPKTRGYSIPDTVNRVLLPKEEKPVLNDPPSLPLFDSSIELTGKKDRPFRYVAGIDPCDYDAKPSVAKIVNGVAEYDGIKGVSFWQMADELPDKIDASDKENVKKVLDAAANRKKKKR